MIAAIVLARGGSKRIPGKNFKRFAGEPVIHYPLRAAVGSGVFDRILVSTDCSEIREVAESVGAEVPFLRPADLAGDHVPTAHALAHAVRWLNEHGPRVRYVCGIYAAAPFVQPRDLRSGLDLLRRTGAATVLPVATFAFPVQRALEIDETGSLRMIWKEHELTRSNDLPEAFHDAGQFYWLDAERFLDSERLYGDPMLPLVLPRYRVQDLDTPEDWEMAERLFEADRARASSR
ncbi:MAG: pseudaminic acid cytidylyltransferase [Myxococcota bacterium]